jgi:DNA invertase Pin-like site-specific DNA recombinase
MQLGAIKAAGCTKVFKDKISANKERPELEKMISFLQTGDTLVVWKLDRFGRSLRHLIDLVKTFEEKKV